MDSSSDIMNMEAGEGSGGNNHLFSPRVPVDYSKANCNSRPHNNLNMSIETDVWHNGIVPSCPENIPKSGVMTIKEKDSKVPQTFWKRSSSSRTQWNQIGCGLTAICNIEDDESSKI